MIALGIVEHGWAGGAAIDRLHQRHYAEMPLVVYRAEGDYDPIWVAVRGAECKHKGGAWAGHGGWAVYTVADAALRAVLPRLSGVRRMMVERALGEPVDTIWRGRNG